MEAVAKAVTQCDNCKQSLSKDKDPNNQNIKATLENGKKEHQDYHFCDEECLRQYLNTRAKRKKATASEIVGMEWNSQTDKLILEITNLLKK